MRDEIQAMRTEDAAALGKLAGDRSIEAHRAGRRELAEAYQAVVDAALAALRDRKDPVGTPLGLDVAAAEVVESTVRALAAEDYQAFRDVWATDAAEDGPLAVAAFAIAHCADGPPERDPDDVGALVGRTRTDDDGAEVVEWDLSQLAPREADEIRRAQLDAELDVAVWRPDADGAPGQPL